MDSAQPAIRASGLVKRYATATALWTASTSRSRPAPSAASSARTAPARRPRCGSSRRSPAGCAARATVAGHDVVREAGAVRAPDRAGRPARGPRRVAQRPREPRDVRAPVPPRVGRAPARRADELLERFGLEDAADRPVKRYSGGMRRRLDLAASLVLAPAVLFLDEPTTGLDPRGRNEVWDGGARRSSREGTTVLLTTQYLDEADQLADRISVIDRGRVIAEGTPDELKRRVGGDRLDVVVRDATRLEDAAAIVARVAGAEADLDADARRVSAPVSDRMRALTGLLAAWRRRDRGGGRRAAATHPGRGVPAPDRPRHRAGRRRDGRGGGGMTAATTTPAPGLRTELRWLLADVWTLTLRGLPLLAARADPDHRGPRLQHHARRPVRVPVRRRDDGAGRRLLHRVPDAGDVRHDHGVRGRGDDDRGDQGRGQGRHRPVPLDAHVVGGGAPRPWRVGHALRGARARRDDRRAACVLGWRWHTGPAEVAAAIGLLLLLRLAMLWAGMWMGLVFTGAAALAIVQTVMFPVTMVTNTFAPTDTMPAWLGTLAEWNPLSATVTATRQLFGNPGVGGDSFVARNAIQLAVLWPVVLTGAFLPLAVRRYRRLDR